MRHSLDQKFKAREMFINQGMTYEEVARQTGISLSTLKQWGTEGDWFKERQEFESRFLQMTSGIDQRIIDQIAKAARSQEPQDFYAIGNLVSTRAKITSTFRGRAGAEDRAAWAIDLLEKLVTFLRERDSEALRYLGPHLRAFTDELKASA